MGVVVSRRMSRVKGGLIVQQLALDLALTDELDFASFYPAGNAPLVHHLRQLAAGEAQGPLVIWGSRGSGRSHLLQATCHHALQSARRVAWLPMSEAAAWQPDILEGLESLDLLCLDDIDAVAGQMEWEKALFRLLQWQRDSGGCLLASSQSPPASSAFQLPDLTSRLEWGQVIKLQALDDESLVAALQLRAKCKGLQLGEEVASYLTRHMHRDMPELTRVLATLDQASLAHQRRMTIPFVKSVLQV